MIVIEPTPPSDGPDALAHVLASPPGARLAEPDQVAAFLNYLELSRLEWKLWRCRDGSESTAHLLVLFLPGQTALFMLPALETRGVRPDHQGQIVLEIVKQLADKDLYFYQTLIEPEATGKRQIIVQAGFQHLTRLIYLQRVVNAGMRRERNSPGIVWTAYSADTHRDFAQILPATYEDSADCPELSDLRPIEAVIAAHKAAGAFDPTLWEIARHKDVPAACLLLAHHPHGDMMEIVYLGVTRCHRKLGIGGALLRRALDRCREREIGTLTAVVDERNAPARRLYARYAFKAAAAREAFLLIPSGARELRDRVSKNTDI